MMPQPLADRYAERYRVYVETAGEKLVLFEEAPTIEELTRKMEMHPPGVRLLCTDVLHEQPYRFMWWYRVEVIRRIPLRELGLA